MNSRMEIRVCEGGQYAPIGHSFFLKTVNWLISCPSKISVSFRAWKACAWIHWSPGLDNIEVYIESPFTTNWSCYFTKGDRGDCGITQDDMDSGEWSIQSNNTGGYFYTFISWRRGAAEFTLPFEVEAAPGRLSFWYYSFSGRLEITICDGELHKTLEPTDRKWIFVSEHIACSSKIRISLKAVRIFHWAQWSDLRIDDIEVFKDLPLTSTKNVHTSTPADASYQTSADTPTPGSTSPALKNQTSSVIPTSISYRTSMTLSYTTLQGKPPKVETSTWNPKMPNKGTEKGGAETTIISVVTVVAFLVAAGSAIFVIVLCRRRTARQNNGTPESRKQPDGNVYTNTAFSANGIDTDQPDVIRGVGFRNGPGSPHLSTLLTNPGRSTSHHQEEGYLEYGEEHPYALGQGDYAGLRGLDESKHQEENGELEYFVLEGPSNVDNDRQQSRLEPCDAEDQVYDHLNRDTDNTNGHQEQLHEKTYGAVAALSDRDHYDILARSCETELNQRKRQDLTHPKKTATEGAQDFENEYHTLNPSDEKKSKLFDNIDENNYNVLRETVDDVDRNDISPKTSEGDNTTRDDYHILHSGKELDDYHEYQYPDHPLFSGSTANAKENEGRDQDYFRGRGENGNNELQRAESSSADADEQAYDHLNRDLSNVTMVHDQGLKGPIKEASSKGNREQGDDYYSVVNVQDQAGTGYEQHEPLYSSEVYSELA